MSILFTILYSIGMILIAIAGMLFLKKYLFDKVRINKYIPLAGAIILFLLELFIRINNFFVNSIVILLAVYLFFWFWDIQQTGGPKIEKKIVIKPKAKPNRVKNKKK